MQSKRRIPPLTTAPWWPRWRSSARRLSTAATCTCTRSWACASARARRGWTLPCCSCGASSARRASGCPRSRWARRALLATLPTMRRCGSPCRLIALGPSSGLRAVARPCCAMHVTVAAACASQDPHRVAQCYGGAVLPPCNFCGFFAVHTRQQDRGCSAQSGGCSAAAAAVRRARRRACLAVRCTLQPCAPARPKARRRPGTHTLQPLSHARHNTAWRTTQTVNSTS